MLFQQSYNTVANKKIDPSRTLVPRKKPFANFSEAESFTEDENLMTFSIPASIEINYSARDEREWTNESLEMKHIF